MTPWRDLSDGGNTYAVAGKSRVCCNRCCVHMIQWMDGDILNGGALFNMQSLRVLFKWCVMVEPMMIN